MLTRVASIKNNARFNHASNATAIKHVKNFHINSIDPMHAFLHSMHIFKMYAVPDQDVSNF